MNWFMIWLDVNAIVGVLLCARFGLSGVDKIRKALIDRLMRGVNGR